MAYSTEYAREYARKRRQDPEFRERKNEIQKEYRQRTKAKGKMADLDRRHKLKSRYGITEDDYNALAKAQGYRCAICQVQPDENQYLHVDHCHKSTKVRGLLCRSCNTSLGGFKDDPALLHSAIEYLTTYHSTDTVEEVRA